ncbi:MAG TPA: molybdopterin-dependent oxidoreductase [Alphaproteobacteria bacterium]|nr:molybdopterin-dependent oxidoreductase [Alphaproteobacteria bacterium]
MAMVRTTCPYCGVGCGIVAQTGADGSVSIAGDLAHPANLGRLCSKGTALAETLGLANRLLYPEIGGQRTDWETALDRVARGFAETISRHGPDSVAFYVSGQLLTEDYYVANKLMKGFIGAANIDTNSRLCMASSVAAHVRAFGEDIVPGNYEDLEEAELIVCVGSNAAWCHPVLFQRIATARERNPALRLVVIDPRRTATVESADLHLALRPGSDVTLFNGLLAHLARSGKADADFVQRQTQDLEDALAAAKEDASSLDRVAAACGLDIAEVARFFDWFAATERTVTLYSQGVNQSTSGTDKVNAIINCHLLTGRIGRAGMGPFSLTGQPNAMGGREVGGLANQLAVHMRIEDPEARAQVQRFWNAPVVAGKPGLKAVELFDAVAAGRIRAIWIMATNPVVSLPAADRVRAALQRCDLVVVSDCVRDSDTARLAHILLPALAWGEKDGTVTNSERRISRQRAFLPPPGEAKPDWWIVSQVASRLGHAAAFAYHSAAEIFREHAALSGLGNDGSRRFDISALAAIDDEAYDSLPPVQWPVTARRPGGTARLLGDERFKGRFVAVRQRRVANEPDKEFPLALNTGRVRDHWHTMTRTGLSPRLSGHTPEPFVAIHPADAAAAGVAGGDLARIVSPWGEMIARVQCTGAQRPGTVFAPMHWTDAFTACGRVDAMVNPAVDPVSGQPELKHTPVRVERFTVAWQAVALTRRPIDVTGSAYWARLVTSHGWRYELAGAVVPQSWDEWVRTLPADERTGEWIVYRDPRHRVFRAALLQDGRLEACVLVGSDVTVSREWLADLFTRNALSAADRMGLLAGRPMAAAAEPGPVVCACFGVGEGIIRAAIRERGLSSVEAIGGAVRAGTNCGSCRPELASLLRAESGTGRAAAE